MKSLRNLCIAVALAFVMTLTAFAGEMTTTVADPPPSVETDGEMTTTVAGQIQPGVSEAIDPFAGAAISLLQSVLPLL